MRVRQSKARRDIADLQRGFFDAPLQQTRSRAMHNINPPPLPPRLGLLALGFELPG